MALTPATAYVLPVNLEVLQAARMATTVTSKGQVTIPKPVRERLGIEPGDAVEFEVAADQSIILVKVTGERPPSRFESLRGRAGPGLSTDEIMALTRGE